MKYNNDFIIFISNMGQKARKLNHSATSSSGQQMCVFLAFGLAKYFMSKSN